jgi:putative nucleotidyltransferase with HDIG domain
MLPVHELIEVIIKTLDTRDPYTFEHSWRVAAISEILAKLLKLEPEYIQIIHIAAHLHDIGKIGISDAILNKPSRLTVTEFEEMKNHSQRGFEIVSKTKRFHELSPYILHHHEHWNGQGYPKGLAGKAIPIGSRIISVADAFDAITSSRPYRPARSYDEGFDEIFRYRGTQFCPDTVNALVDNHLEIRDQLERANEDIQRYKQGTVKNWA